MSLAPGERRACHACGTMIVGARSSSNPASVLPVDLEPDDEKGNVLIQQKGGELVAFVFGNPVVRGALRDAGVVLRQSHFATCPQAGAFRR